MAKSTGGSGSFVLNGIVVNFNTIDASVEKEHDDSTDSSNYDTASGLVHKSQLAVTTQTTFDIEGKIDLAVTPLALVGLLYTNPGALPATFKYNSSTVYGHGNVDVTNFKTTVDPTKVIPFTATLMTNGVFAVNS
jgi:hypothetical protein